mgnify:CR=1 FL=1
MHGADIDAACAADAGGILAGGGQILLAQAEHAVAGLPHGDGQIILGKAHHRAAGDHPGGGPVKAAGLLNQVREGGAHRRQQVDRVLHGAASDGDHPLIDRQAQCHSVIDGRRGRRVEDAASHICGQLAWGGTSRPVMA